MRLNILFTSVGRRVELMRAFRRALGSLPAESHIVATDIDPLAPAVQEVGRFVRVPRFDDPEYVPALLQAVRDEKIDVVFPLIDPDIPVLAGARGQFEEAGARLAVVGAEAAEISADKWAAFRFFKQLGLDTPRSWLPGQLEPEDHEFPRFIKPRRGSAAANTFKLNNAQELRFFQDYIPDPIIQEFLPGDEITTDIVCGLDGTVLATCSRQRIAVRSGEVVKGFTVRDPAITEACLNIARRLPAAGPITAQCMLKDGVPHFIEINARLGGGIPLAIAAGVDVPRLLASDLLGLPIGRQRVDEYKTGLYMTRFDESFFLCPDEIAGNHL